MRHHRLVLITSLLAVGMVLSGCGSIDPTEWFNTKKPLPGERKDMFPEGVPGVPQGVPPELVEGYTPPVEPVPEPLPVREQPKAKPKPKPRPKVAAAPRPTAVPPQQQTQQQGGGQAPWPAAPAPGPAAPPSQSQSAFPDPPRR
jgi:hypothetical protein